MGYDVKNLSNVYNNSVSFKDNRLTSDWWCGETHLRLERHSRYKMRWRYWWRPHDSHLLVAATVPGTKYPSELSTHSLYLHRTINPSWITFRDTCYFVQTARANILSVNDSHRAGAGKEFFTAICQPLYRDLHQPC
jgi:hypothetical protein